MNPGTEPTHEEPDVVSGTSAAGDLATSDSGSGVSDPPAQAPAESRADGEPQPPESDEVAKKGEIRSLHDLIDDAYAQAGKKVQLKAAEVETLDSDLIDIGIVEQHVKTLARSDRHLAVPVRLLAALDRSSASIRLRKKINRLATFALTEVLPELREPDGQPLLVPSERLDTFLDDLETLVSNATLGELGFSDGDAADRAAVLDNACTVLVLVAASEHNWPAHQTIRTLDRRVWRRQLARSKKRPDVGQLAESRSPETLALVGDSYTAEIEQVQRAVDRAARDQAQAEAETQAARDEVTTVQYQVSTLESTVEKLRSELNATIAERDQARESARVTGSHAVDDFEQLRTRIVRMLRDRLRMLDDALHALQNERYQVTEEFVERVIEELRREYESMQPGTGGEE